MSLINDALKKAQCSRTADPADLGIPIPGGDSRIARRRPATSARTMLLYASGGLVLFVLCVVGTVWVLNRPAPVAPVAQAKPAPTVAGPTPTVSAPVIAVPKVDAPSSPAPTPVVAASAPPTLGTPTPPPVAKASAPVAEPPKPSLVATPPSASSTPPPAVLPAAAVVVPDERINLFLDGLRINAVRMQPGGDSRVMMNDRVFRLNDVVDRTLNLRLTKVDPNQLTFTDANGHIYGKFF